jgi:hypothetical protein
MMRGNERGHAMKPCRALPLAVAVLLFAVNGAAAQFPPQEPPCMKDFAPLRDDAAKKAGLIRAASERKATAPEACALFNSFSAAEAKVVKYAKDNATWCNIPPQAVQEMATAHKRTLQMRANICKAAANPPRPAGPSLSDALGAPSAAAPDTIKRGSGTFDTLTGTPLGGSTPR